jgi:hypothetical protein
MSGLKANDFHIYEEDRLQDITLFNTEDVPASVGLSDLFRRRVIALALRAGSHRSS